MTGGPPAPGSVPPAPPSVSNGAGKGADLLDGTWRRLHPATMLVIAIRSGLPLLVLLALSARSTSSAASGGLAGAFTSNTVTTRVEEVLFGVAVLAAVIRWAVTRWRVEQATLCIESGLVRRRSRRIPLERLQAVDLVRIGTARMLGLVELRIRTAGDGGGTARLAYLDGPTGEALRSALFSYARSLGGSGSSSLPAETTLLSVSSDRVIGSTFLRGIGSWTLAVGGGSCAILASSPSPGTGALAGAMLAFTVFSLVPSVVHTVLGETRFVLSEASDGLHLRSGLVQTQHETLPHSRVQALRRRQPLLWRPFGWCRVEVLVAGKAQTAWWSSWRSTERAQRRVMRALLPVGSADVADALVELVLPGSSFTLGRPPRRSRWKAPLSYHFRGAAVSERYLVSAGGRLQRSVSVIPLDKIQSIRLSEGPIQRRLKLASVYVDVAGRHVATGMIDRDVVEARQVFAELPRRCAAARTAARTAGCRRGAGSDDPVAR
jgi:putative membrane protein